MSSKSERVYDALMKCTTPLTQEELDRLSELVVEARKQQEISVIEPDGSVTILKKKGEF